MIPYLISLLRHKWFVFLEACKLGVPCLGLIHDLSKFTPREFFAYARYFYGPQDDFTKFFSKRAFSVAWNHHQKRNKHHWQYWLLTNDSDEPQTVALPMPYRYVLEMVADWRGAGRAYGNPDTIRWYESHRDNQIMHPDTRHRVEALLYGN